MMDNGFGGPGRDRTDDLFHAMEARSQLRHRPTSKSREITLTSMIFAQLPLIVKPGFGAMYSPPPFCESEET
jgi:hypothetical protein